VLEQYQNNRIYRPRGLYKGPTDLRYVPIDRR
jgi:citrate synthase